VDLEKNPGSLTDWDQKDTNKLPDASVRKTRGCFPIFRSGFVRMSLHRFIEKDLLNDWIWPPRQMRYSRLTAENYREDKEFLRRLRTNISIDFLERSRKENYVEHQQKKVPSFPAERIRVVGRADGRQIPWNFLKHR